MFELRKCTILRKILLILNLMAATCLKSWDVGKQKVLKQLEEHFVTNRVNWQQVSNMIGCKKEHQKSLSVSTVCCAIHKCRLKSHHAKKSNMNRNPPVFSGPKLI